MKLGALVLISGVFVFCQPVGAQSQSKCADFERPVRLTLFETPEKNLISKSWTASSKELAEAQLENRENYFEVRRAVQFARLIRDDQDAIYRVRFRYQRIDSSKTKISKQNGVYLVQLQHVVDSSAFMQAEQASKFLLHDLAKLEGITKIEMETAHLKRSAAGLRPCP